MKPCVSHSLEVGNTFLILSSLEANSKNVFLVVRFYTGKLFSIDFSLNFFKSLLVMHYVACSFFSAQTRAMELKGFSLSPKF